MAFTPVLVIRQDANYFINSDGSYGYVTAIPTPLSGGRIDCDYWASPVNLHGIVGKGLNFSICQPTDTIKPDVQSFHVVRITAEKESTCWYALGTSTQYSAAAYDAEIGHSTPPVLMPSTVVNILPSQNVCHQNRQGLYIAMLAAPTLLANLKYYASGFFNNVALPALSSTGYSTAATLLAAMNSLWSIAGTWSYSASDNITFQLTQASGPGTDVLTASITVA